MLIVVGLFSFSENIESILIWKLIVLHIRQRKLAVIISVNLLDDEKVLITIKFFNSVIEFIDFKSPKTYSERKKLRGNFMR